MTMFLRDVSFINDFVPPEVLIEILDNNVSTGIITCNHFVIEDFPKKIAQIFGTKLDNIGHAKIDKRFIGSSYYSGKDLKAMINMDLIKGYLEHLYLQNIKEKILAKTQCPWVYWGNEQCNIESFVLQAYLQDDFSIYDFCSLFITEFLRHVKDIYLVERSKFAIDFKMSQEGNCYWEIKGRYAILPDARIDIDKLV